MFQNVINKTRNFKKKSLTLQIGFLMAFHDYSLIRATISFYHNMQEFIELQKRCLSLLQSHTSCEHSCLNGFYCKQLGCNECDCSRCINHIQWNSSPSFTYNCERITYQYVLRFFNRFASEIYYAISLYDMNNPKRINVVSLGCGPGSEIYGIIKALQQKKYNTVLYYEGYDPIESWGSVQQLSKECLARLDHSIEFYASDLFKDFRGFDNGKVDLLILNYLLSDSVKFSTKEKNTQFIEQIHDFIIEHNIKNILFNDIGFYGDPSSLNSGFQLIRELILKLKDRGLNVEDNYWCFKNNKFKGGEDWKEYKSDRLQFQDLDSNSFIENLGYCNSKQVFIHLNSAS